MLSRESVDIGGKSSWSKWWLAVIIGAPVTIGLGYYLLRKKDSPVDSSSKKPAEKSKPTPKEPAAPPRPQTPLERALSLKSSGNELFQKRQLSDAIKCYSEAISICPENESDYLATFYQNRAAAHELLGNSESALEDCSKAIELNPTYLKALNRRFKACEKLGKLKLALEDITAICIVEKFENMETLRHADRILKKYGAELGKEAMARRVPMMPSDQFIQAYFSSFCNDPIINCVKEFHGPGGDTALTGYYQAMKALKEQRYDDVIDACMSELRNINESNPLYYKTLLTRGSMYILRTEVDNAMNDLSTIVEDRPSDMKIVVNALVKRAALHLQCEDLDKCMEDFSLAESLDDSNADIYHHRGQVLLLNDRLEEALKDFEQAVIKAPDFGLALIQKLYTQYRLAALRQDLARATKYSDELAEAAARLTNYVQGYLLLGQVYAEQRNFNEAERAFDKALQHDPKNATVLVHKGLLELQTKENYEKAVEYFEKAISVDDKCEFGYETLAAIEVQRGNLVRAVELFKRAQALAKNEKELSHICSLKAAAEAQQVAAARLNIPKSFGINF